MNARKLWKGQKLLSRFPSRLLIEATADETSRIELTSDPAPPVRKMIK
jgi:hypothetical protein